MLQRARNCILFSLISSLEGTKAREIERWAIEWVSKCKWWLSVWPSGATLWLVEDTRHTQHWQKKLNSPNKTLLILMKERRYSMKLSGILSHPLASLSRWNWKRSLLSLHVIKEKSSSRQFRSLLMIVWMQFMLLCWSYFAFFMTCWRSN